MRQKSILASSIILTIIVLLSWQIVATQRDRALLPPAVSLDFGDGDHVHIVQSGIGKLTDPPIRAGSHSGWSFFKTEISSGETYSYYHLDVTTTTTNGATGSIEFDDHRDRFLVELYWETNGAPHTSQITYHTGHATRPLTLAIGENSYTANPDEATIALEYQDSGGAWRFAAGPFLSSTDPMRRAVFAIDSIPENAPNISCRVRLEGKDPQPFELANPIALHPEQTFARTTFPSAHPLPGGAELSLESVQTTDHPVFGPMLMPRINFHNETIRDGIKAADTWNLETIELTTPRGFSPHAAAHYGALMDTSVWEHHINAWLFKLDPDIDSFALTITLRPNERFHYPRADCIPIASCEVDEHGNIGPTTIIPSPLGLESAEIFSETDDFLKTTSLNLRYSGEFTIDSALQQACPDWEEFDIQVFYDDEEWSHGGFWASQLGNRSQSGDIWSYDHHTSALNSSHPIRKQSKVTFAIVKKLHPPVILTIPVHRDQLTPYTMPR